MGSSIINVQGRGQMTVMPLLLLIVRTVVIMIVAFMRMNIITHWIPIAIQSIATQTDCNPFDCNPVDCKPIECKPIDCSPIDYNPIDYKLIYCKSTTTNTKGDKAGPLQYPGARAVDMSAQSGGHGRRRLGQALVPAVQRHRAHNFRHS